MPSEVSSQLGWTKCHADCHICLCAFGPLEENERVLILAILISFTRPVLVSTCVQARSADQREPQIVAPDATLLRWNLEREADQLVGNSCTTP